jgi:putative peptide maturation system protein
MDLLWEEEACDRSVHYDALLHEAGQGTVSLSFCPERALPWPLRGVQRWSEMNLVRVNATVLKVDQAVALLDFIWDDAPMLKRLVHAALVREALNQDPVALGDEDLQRALNAFRRTHRLHKAADMHRWMADRGLTQEKLECLVVEHAQIAALRDRVTGGRVDEYFALHRAEFDTLSLAQFAVSDVGEAQRIVEQIRSGAVDFAEAAERSFLSGRTVPVEPFAVIRRGQAPPELLAAFSAESYSVLGPVRSGEANKIVRVLSKMPASLDGPTRSVIQDLLFEEWLEDRREKSSIEWYWGESVPPLKNHAN